MPIYCALFIVVGTTSAVNLSNSTNVKLVNILSNLGIAHIIMSTSWTPTLGSTHWPAPLFNSLALNTWNELAATSTHAKAHCLCLSMFTNNCFNISLSLEKEELKPPPKELKPWLENEAMISKWKYLSQVKWKKIICGRQFHLYNPTL